MSLKNITRSVAVERATIQQKAIEASKHLMMDELRAIHALAREYQSELRRVHDKPSLAGWFVTRAYAVLGQSRDITASTRYVLALSELAR